MRLFRPASFNRITRTDRIFTIILAFFFFAVYKYLSSGYGTPIHPTQGEIPSTVKQLIRSNKVIIFSKTYCPYCAKAKKMMESKSINYVAIELDERSDGPDIQQYLGSLTGIYTVPHIHINQNFVGGYEQLEILDSDGELDKILKSAN